MQSELLLIICILACLAVGELDAVLTWSGKTWFQGLRKPRLLPPLKVMGLVWLVLYVLMGTALFLIMRLPADTPGRLIALILFWVQMVLNLFWPFVFFRMKHPFVALAEMLAMWMFLMGTMIAFIPLSTTAAWCMAPVLVCVAFEAYLNFMVISLNDQPA